MKIFIFLCFFTILLYADKTLGKEKSLHQFLDNWHHAAAIADEQTFFSSMAEDSVYIGTDATERWSKQVFQKWCGFAFARESAWTFIPLERKIYFAEESNYAWFDETLDTWMGICRASGVVVYSDEKWKIKHYHLSVTIPNELVMEFIDLVKQDPYITVKEFDDKRNAVKDIAYAILQAKKHQKKMLLVIGETNSECGKLDKVLLEEKTNEYITNNYIFLKIHNSENNRKLLAKYSPIVSTPYLIILDDNAQHIRSQQGLLLQQNEKYNVDKVRAFLEQKN